MRAMTNAIRRAAEHARGREAEQRYSDPPIPFGHIGGRFGTAMSRKLHGMFGQDVSRKIADATFSFDRDSAVGAITNGETPVPGEDGNLRFYVYNAVHEGRTYHVVAEVVKDGDPHTSISFINVLNAHTNTLLLQCVLDGLKMSLTIYYPDEKVPDLYRDMFSHSMYGYYITLAKTAARKHFPPVPEGAKRTFEVKTQKTSVPFPKVLEKSQLFPNTPLKMFLQSVGFSEQNVHASHIERSKHHSSQDDKTAYSMVSNDVAFEVEVWRDDPDGPCMSRVRCNLFDHALLEATLHPDTMRLDVKTYWMNTRTSFRGLGDMRVHDHIGSPDVRRSCMSMVLAALKKHCRLGKISELKGSLTRYMVFMDFSDPKRYAVDVNEEGTIVSAVDRVAVKQIASTRTGPGIPRV